MKLLRWLLLILIALLVVGAIAIWTFPAELAYRWNSDKFGPIQLSGVSGTVWSGRAEQVTAFGQALGALDWQLAKRPLLERRVVVAVHLGSDAIDARGELAREPDARIIARNVEFSLPAALAEPALDIPLLHLLGEVRGTLVEATVNGGWVARAHGAARWTGAGVAGRAEARFGDLVIEFASQPDASILGTVKDDGSGSLAVDGRFVVSTGQFDAEARLSARHDDLQVREALQYVGQPQPDGSSLLKIHGQLFKLF